MKKSVVAPTTLPSSRKRAALRSASSRGATPASAASRTTLEECSSVPVRKKTSSPRWR